MIGFHTAFVTDERNALGEGAAAGVQVELPLMPGACHDRSHNLPGGQISSRVGTTVLCDDEAIGIGQVKDGQFVVAARDKACPTDGAFADRQQSSPTIVRHGA